MLNFAFDQSVWVFKTHGFYNVSKLKQLLRLEKKLLIIINIHAKLYLDNCPA